MNLEQQEKDLRKETLLGEFSKLINNIALLDVQIGIHKEKEKINPNEKVGAETPAEIQPKKANKIVYEDVNVTRLLEIKSKEREESLIHLEVIKGLLE